MWVGRAWIDMSMGYSDDEMHRISMSSLLPDPTIGQLARGSYRPRAMRNGMTYLFAAGAVVLPVLGLVAIVLAVRGIRQKRRGAWRALAVALAATAIGVFAWATVLPSTGSSQSPGLQVIVFGFFSGSDSGSSLKVDSIVVFVSQRSSKRPQARRRVWH